MTKSPRARRRQRKEASILDAAIALIVAHGLENVSLRDIAKQADYTPAALYKYFPSKLALLQAVQKRENQHLLEALQELPQDQSPPAALIDLCLVYIQYCLAHPAYLALINALPSSRTSTRQPLPETSPYLVFLQAVQRWMTVKDIPSQQGYGDEEITYALWSMIHGMATLRLNQLKDFKADFDHIHRKSLEIFLQGYQSHSISMNKLKN